MKIELHPEQELWLKAQVKAGRFPSLDAAVRAAVTQLQAEAAIDDDWVKPLIEEAVAQVDEAGAAKWDIEDIRRHIHARNPDLANGQGR